MEKKSEYDAQVARHRRSVSGPLMRGTFSSAYLKKMKASSTGWLSRVVESCELSLARALSVIDVK